MARAISSRARPAPNLGHGRIYAVFGQLNFRANRPINLSSTTTGADIVWTTATAGAELGKVLYAATPSPGRSPFILAAAPGALVTHLFSDVRPSTTSAPSRQIDADAADHPTFTGIAAAALAAGDLDGQAASGQRLQIAIADPGYRLPSDTAMRRGKIYLFANVAPTGTAPIDAASASPTITGKDKNSQLGASLLIADTSGNGDDLFAGAPGDDSTGVVYVFKHATGLLLPSELSTTDTDNVVPIAGYEQGGLFGSALASTRAGSANGVGLRLAVGAPNVSLGSNRVAIGAAYLYKADTPAQVPDLRAGLRQGRRRRARNRRRRRAARRSRTGATHRRSRSPSRRTPGAATPARASSTSATGSSSAPRAADGLRAGRRRAEQGCQAAADRPSRSPGRTTPAAARARRPPGRCRRPVLGRQHDQVVAAVAVDVAGRGDDRARARGVKSWPGMNRAEKARQPLVPHAVGEPK